MLSFGLAVGSFVDTRAHQQRARDADVRAKAPLPPPRDAAALRDELRAEPLQPVALRELAGTGDRQDIALLKLADRVSRRDPATQILLLDEAARAGDVDQALRHYDVLLSTRPTAAPALYAQLAIALQSDEIRQKLRPYGKRDWFPGLIAVAATTAADPRPAATLAAMAQQFDDPQRADYLAPLLLGRMVQQGYLEEAFALAPRAAVRGQLWKDFGFTRASLSERLAPLTWALMETANARAELAPNGNVTATIDPLTSAQLLRRVTRLRPGSYTLRQTVIRSSAPAAVLEWQMRCSMKEAVPAPAFLWQQRQPLTQERHFSTAQISIPEGCAYQEWTLRGQGEDAQSPSSFYFEDFSLEAR